MSRKILLFFLGVMTGILTAVGLKAQIPSSFLGEWRWIPAQSTSIPLMNELRISFREGVNTTDTIFFIWGKSDRTHHDTLLISGRHCSWKVPDRVFPYNVFLGLRMPAGSEIPGRVTLAAPDSFLLSRHYQIFTSQGEATLQETSTFVLSHDHHVLKVRISQSRGDSIRVYHYLLKKKGFREAYAVRLTDDWSLQGDLDVQVLLLSLQGLVNRQGPRLYFLYPDDWDYRYTGDILHYLEKEKFFTFSSLKTFDQLFSLFRDDLKGYVIWDKKHPVTLDLAFTLAGCREAVVVSEELVPLVERAGLSLVADLRGRFGSMPDAMIYKAFHDSLSSCCSGKMIVWLGGEHGQVRKPAIADWGVMNKAFFTDLSTDPKDTLEYHIADRLLASLPPMGMVFGWHVYGKDKERDYVRLASRHGLRVEGLHTLPNMSFLHHIPLEKDFVFRNHHHVQPKGHYHPQRKVYISCVQTDCLGLGAWNQPGRGEIPYAWEVTMNWYHLAPVLLEYFYSQATGNDYFIGSLSGPGYMYPKAVPDTLLGALLDSAWQLMQVLDLNVFEIMDYSEGATLEGNTDLTREVVDQYYQHMPEAIGFINGYAPAFTFTSKKGRPLVSYDYYLDPGRSVGEAVEDLRELASLNRKRPYFLLIHVRQWNNIDKVTRILDELGQDFEVVPLDLFLKMAGEKPTFRERFLDDGL